MSERKIRLKDYWHKKVKIIDNDGYFWTGKVFSYTKADDNPDGDFAEIYLDVKNTNKDKDFSNKLLTFTENDIAEIEEIN